MTPRKILVTGAAGFIGSRLCERLKLHYQLPFRALVRNFANAKLIARMDVEMVRGDLKDKESIRNALQGCDTVVHLAHGNPRLTPDGNLLSACSEANLKKFVHISSMAVHGPNPGPECVHEETATIRHYGEEYSDSKAGVERLIQRAIKRQGLPAVILRPTVVYGPYSPFVMAVVASAKQGAISLIDGGAGVCNAVYVDDVCDSIHAAIHADQAIGKAFFINADHAISWREFNLTFAQMVRSTPQIQEFSAEEVRKHWLAKDPNLRSNVSAVKNLVVSSDFHDQLSKIPALHSVIAGTKRFLVAHLPDQKVSTMRARYQSTNASASSSRDWPNRGRLVREAFRLEFSNDLAKKLLNWKPAYDFQQGAEITRSWLRFARLLPTDQDWIGA